MTNDVADHRRRASSVRPVRQDGHGDGRRSDPVRADRRGGRLEGHPVRLRRQLRGLQPRCRHPAGRPDRHHVHQCLQRLRHRGVGHPADGRHDPAGQVRHRDRHRPRQAPARRVHRRSGQARASAVVRRERAVRHHQVLRHEGQPLHPQARHLAGDAGAGGEQELPQRRARTRMRSAARRSPSTRSSTPPC